MKHSNIIVEAADQVLTITINRPSKLNALSVATLAELKAELLALKAQPTFKIKGLILTGAGEKAFIAGADIRDQARMSPEEGEAFGRLGQEVADLLESVPVPTIACVNGYALGGGCEMAMGCDFIYATENAQFGQPEVNLGLIPGFGGCIRLPKRVGLGVAKEMIYSGRRVCADDAKELGLVNRVFTTKAHMIDTARATLGTIAQKSPIAVAISKSVITSGEFSQERHGFRQVFETQDKAIGVAAFLAKETPRFLGC